MKKTKTSIPTLDQRIQTFYDDGTHNATSIYNKVARVEDVSLRTVQRKVTMIREHGEVIYPTYPNRASQIVDDGMEEEIRTLIEESPNPQNSTTIMKSLQISCHSSTISRTMKKMGYEYKRARTVELLTVQQMEDRVQFCRNHQNEDLRRIVFLDECGFDTFSSKNFGYQLKGTPLVKEKPVHPPRVNACVAISSSGAVLMGMTTETINGPRFEDMFTRMLPKMRVLIGDNFKIFMDNGGQHFTDSLVLKYNRARTYEIVWDWPANSPDLNPIENFWSYFKSHITENDCNDVETLELAIRRVFRSVDQELLANFIDSFPTRLAECIENDGRRVEY